MAVDDLATTRKSRFPTFSRPATHIGDAPQRPNQTDHTIAEQGRRGRVLNTAGSAQLGNRSTVAVQESLEDGKTNLCGVVGGHVREELRVRAGAEQVQRTQRSCYRVLQRDDI